MRLVLALLVAVAFTGCDSSEPERIYQNVYVKAESVTLVSITSGSDGRPEAVFNYVGSVPAPCYEISGYGATGEDRQLLIGVTARATAEACAGGRSTVRYERLALGVPSSEPGTYTYAFDRRDKSPIEVSVTFP